MKFEYNPRILEQLGTELITSDEVAFTELLKNSYDARAKEVRVHFLDSVDKLDPAQLLVSISEQVLEAVRRITNNGKIIVIEDTGTGMDKARLREGFFTIGSDLKQKLKEAEAKAGRRVEMTLGDKGLGRLSSQRLAQTLIVETSSQEEKHINLVEIKWADFARNSNAEAPEHEVPKIVDQSYTRLWFAGEVDFSKFIDDKREKQESLFEKIAESKENKENKLYLKEKLQSSVSFLYSPFESSKENFDVSFYWNNEKINTSFHNDSKNIAETIHKFRLSNEKTLPVLNLELLLQPWYVEMIHLRLLGKDLFMQRRESPSFYAALLEKHKERLDSSLVKKYKFEDYLNPNREDYDAAYKQALEEIMPVEGEVFSFHREAFRLNIAVNSAKSAGLIGKDENINSIRDFLNYHNGIKLYRDRFRIANLGDKESDWLNLQQARTRGQQFFRFELGNVIGYVKINDFYQRYIQEISSRQELRQTRHASALKLFLQNIFNDEFYKLSTSAYYLVRDILNEEGLIPKKTSQELKRQVDESEERLKETLHSLNVFQNSFNEIKDNISLDSAEKIKKVQKIINNLGSQEASLEEKINSSISTLKTAKDTLTIIEERQKDSYNNYKLMANGLITEVMTHELHSILLNTKSDTDYTHHIKTLQSYLLDAKQIELYKNNLKPISNRLDFLHTRVGELDVFYNFLESTFIKQGTRDDFENEDIKELLEKFQERLSKELRAVKTGITTSDLENYQWYVPKGTLIHVFYNLISNSLHWIGERQKRAAYDEKFKAAGKDFIKVEKIDSNTIYYSDSGTGVIKDLQYSLFHPFATGKENGRGMGMYIVKNLLESFGGSIELLPDLNDFGNRYIFSISSNLGEYEE